MRFIFIQNKKALVVLLGAKTDQNIHWSLANWSSLISVLYLANLHFCDAFVSKNSAI